MVLNIKADVNDDPTVFDKTMHKMSSPEIFSAVSIDVIHDLTLLIVPCKVSTEEITT